MEDNTNWDLHWQISLRMKLRRLRDMIVWRLYRPLVEAMEVKGEFTVLEIAMGEGHNTAMMLKRFGGHGVGIDRSPISIKLASDKMRKFGLTSKVKLIQGDVTDPSVLPEERFYLVHSEGIVEHFRGREQEELFRIHKEMSRRYVMIFTPRPSFVYKRARRFWELTNRWLYPDERPMTSEEITVLGKKVGLKPIKTTRNFWENGVLFEV